MLSSTNSPVILWDCWRITSLPLLKWKSILIPSPNTLWMIYSIKAKKDNWSKLHYSNLPMSNFCIYILCLYLIIYLAIKYYWLLRNLIVVLNYCSHSYSPIFIVNNSSIVQCLFLKSRKGWLCFEHNISSLLDTYSNQLQNWSTQFGSQDNNIYFH